MRKKPTLNKIIVDRYIEMSKKLRSIGVFVCIVLKLLLIVTIIIVANKQKSVSIFQSIDHQLVMNRLTRINVTTAAVFFLLFVSHKPKTKTTSKLTSNVLRAHSDFLLSEAITSLLNRQH